MTPPRWLDLTLAFVRDKIEVASGLGFPPSGDDRRETCEAQGHAAGWEGVARMARHLHDIPREHFVNMGRRSAEARRGGLVLTREEVEALAAAYALIRRAAERARRKLAAGSASEAGEEA